MLRTAVFVVPASATIAVVAVLLLSGVRPAPHRAGTPAVAATPTVRAAAPAAPAPRALEPPPAAGRYSRPVGAQYLEQLSYRFGSRGDAPPALFLVGDAELAGARLGWVMPALAGSLLDELAAVLDDACQGGRCAAAVEAARTRVHELAGAPLEYGPAHARRSTDARDLPTTERRSVAIRSTGAVTVETVCTCRSTPLGMRMWADEVDCVATVRDRGRLVVRYAPNRLRGSEPTGALFDLDAYDQVATFPSGDGLVIESGFEYERRGSDAMLVRTGRVRGGLHWTTHEGPRQRL
ncbi:MAG TPA: hypothetical protein VHW23_41340 [Kofleriaceae bacterium]|jgi:hypothetical protein|nr:hypothetical protein [Kofleriaceae bacterium]